MPAVRSSAWHFVLPAACLAWLAAGCGQTGPSETLLEKLVPVKGKVTLNGKPLEGVMVTYHVADGGISGEVAYGMTDSQGAYSLQTSLVGVAADDAQGAFPGDYRVVITKLVTRDGKPVPPETADIDAEALGARQLLPPQYSNLEKTRLTAVVQKPETINNFELKSKK